MYPDTRKKTKRGIPMNGQTVSAAPVQKLKTNRGLVKTILLSIITLGIYPLVMFLRVVIAQTMIILS